MNRFLLSSFVVLTCFFVHLDDVRAQSLHTAIAGGPTPLKPDVSVQLLQTVDAGAVRLAHDPVSDDLFYLDRSGAIFQVNRVTGASARVLDTSDHSVPETIGFEIGPDGAFYIVGNETVGMMTVGQVVRGSRGAGGGLPTTWNTLAQTEAYPRSGTPFDHKLNAIIVGLDGQSVFVNSGSRTDHGEVQDGGGAFPGLREVPLTSAIFRLPADGLDLVIPADSAALALTGFVHARGFRNSFDFAFAPDGSLFAAENSGDRDDSDELNWIRPGDHYGFPWRMGRNDTPQQFPGYDPDADRLVNKTSFAYTNGFFYDDPSYPPPPSGTVFRDPVTNTGPDADKMRSPTDGSILDASDLGLTVGTWTAHRSPLGLVFDRAGALGEPYANDGFVLGWTEAASNLLGPMDDPSEDVVHLSFTKIDAEDRYEVASERIVAGFSNPVDAVLVDNHLYVLELAFGGTLGLWEVVLPAASTGTGLTSETAAESASLRAPYPNPSTESMTVNYTILKPGRARLVMLDALGRTVATLAEGWHSAGDHRVSANVSHYAVGLYLLRLQTPGRASARSVTVVR